MIKPGSSGKFPLQAPEDDKTQIQEATASPAAAQETGADAAVATVL